MHTLIMAGGVGTRLWPRSRRSMPKQLLNLTGDKTMMQATVERVRPLTPPEHIFVVTGEPYVPLIHEQIPDVPLENLIAEPSGKNTAPAIALGIAHMRRRGIEDTVVVLPADHIILDEEQYRQALRAAEAVAGQGRLVTLGITPTGPETGYGYIHRGQTVGRFNGQEAYQVQRFLEKPSLERAQVLVSTGEYYWNSGMFIWRIDTFCRALAEHMPALFDQADQIERALAGDDPGPTLRAIWQNVQAESIDYGLMERAGQVAVVPIDVGWNDVGSWQALMDVQQPDEKGNVILGSEHLSLDTSDTLIQGTGKLVATIGLQGMVIIETEDALLVCPKDRTQDVKQIVEHLKRAGRTEYL
ncbi:MAG: mannose-1-phosphate guanylyltransferase [Anaerolineae bacterium]